jgi:hypothetical protein
VQRILKEHGPRFVVGAGRGDLTGLTADNGAGADDRGEDDVGDDLPIAPLRASRRAAPAATEGEDEEVEAATDDEAMEAEGDVPDEEDEPSEPIEPAFDPREFRPSAPAGGSIYAKPPSSHFRAAAQDGPRDQARGLAGDDIRRLQATLGELLELKRLLDQARD